MNNSIADLRNRLAIHKRRRILTVPGCWDAFSALLIQQAGFEAAFVTGGGLSMARLGRPDIGMITATELIDTVAQIRDRVSLPLIVDGDTGFGSTQTLNRTVRQLERVGACAIQIEDQEFPKRCGHMPGKSVVPTNEAIDRVKAAVDARENMLISARTDAVAIEGMGAAMDRAEVYLEAGADLIFIEGPSTMQDMRSIADRFAARVPLVHNLVEGGVSPTTKGAELSAIGYAVALHPLVLMHGFAAASVEWLTMLKADGTTDGFAGSICSLAEMIRITSSDAH